MREQRHRVVAVRPSLLCPSARQQQVLDLWVGGHSYKEIAHRLGIGYWTVLAYLRQLYAKWNLYNTDELFEAAIREHYVDLSHLEYARL